MLARLLDESIGMLVGNWHCQLFQQFLHGRKNRGGMRELGEHDEAHRKKRCAAGHRRINHLQHPVGVRPHLRPIGRVREIGLTGGRGVSQMHGDSGCV